MSYRMRLLDKYNSYRLITGFISGLAFLLLMLAVSSTWINSTDDSIRNWILAWNTPPLVKIWKLITVLGSTSFLTTLTATWIVGLVLQRRRKTALWLAVTALGATALDVLGKWLIHRPRPEEIYSGTMPDSYSFPSGHAFYSLVLYSVIFKTLKPLFPASSNLYFALPPVILAISIGTSRLFLGVHYVSDVLGGYLLGWTWLSLMLEIQPFTNHDMKV